MSSQNLLSESDASPIHKLQKELKLFLFSVLNRYQLLLIKDIAINKKSITTVLKKINQEQKVAEATLRYNSKKLLELQIVKFGDKFTKGKEAELTILGKLIYRILFEKRVGN